MRGGDAGGSLKPEEISNGDKSMTEVHRVKDPCIHLVVDVGNLLDSNITDDVTQDDDNPNLFIEVKTKHKKRNSPNGHLLTLVSSGVKTRNKQKADCGSDLRVVGRPPNAISRDNNSQYSIVYGVQITLQDMGIGSPHPVK